MFNPDWSHVVTGSMIERVRTAYQAGLLPSEIAEGEGCPVELVERFVYDLTRVNIHSVGDPLGSAPTSRRAGG